MNLLDNGAPAHVINENGLSPIILVCEHASCHIPSVLENLGLSEDERLAHIAWDIGAEPMARMMSAQLYAPLILQRYSRLVYDCNRPPENPSAWPEKSENTTIPGNVGLSEAQKSARVRQIYKPFHQTVSDFLDQHQQRVSEPVFITIHSFTANYHGKYRDVELGVLHDDHARLADAMLAQAPNDYIARRNEPYGPEDGVTHTLNLHGGERGLKNVMLEVRNDLIADDAGQAIWATRLVELLGKSLTLTES
jgi:predicted N-formylglutamate amidohydrolase